MGLSVVGPTSLGFLTVSGILLDIGQSLHNTSSATLQWITSGYAVGSCVSFPLAGSLSDIFGRRWVIVVGQIIGIVGAVSRDTSFGYLAQTLADRGGKHRSQGLSPKMSQLSSSPGLFWDFQLESYSPFTLQFPRSAQTATGQSNSVTSNAGEVNHRKRTNCTIIYRGLGLAWIEACILFPWGTLSVLLGKEVAATIGWRWIYIFACIYGAVSLIGTMLFYFPPSGQAFDHRTKGERLRQLDFLGLTMFISGITTFLVGLSWAGSASHPWRSASVVCPIVLGGVIFGFSFVYDFFIKKDNEHALFPPDLFRLVRKFTVSLAAIFVAGMIFYPMAALLPQASLYIFTSDHVQLGLIQLPNGIGQTVGAVLGPMLLHKTKRPKYHILFALFLQTLGVGLYAYALPEHKAAWIAFQFFGQGCFSWLSVCCIMNAGLHIKHSELGIATGVVCTFRSLGGSLGVAIFNTIRSSILSTHLVPEVVKAAAQHGFDVSNHTDIAVLLTAVPKAVLGQPHPFKDIPNITTQIEVASIAAFRQAQAFAFTRVFLASIPFGVIAFIAALFIDDASKLMNNHTAIRLSTKRAVI